MKNLPKVITYEDIVQEENKENGVNEEMEEDENFHEVFFREFRRRELEEKMRLREDDEEEDEEEQERINLLSLLEDEPEFFDKTKKMQEKKDLKPVDHSQIEYEAFKKNFYREGGELEQLT